MVSSWSFPAPARTTSSPGPPWKKSPPGPPTSRSSPGPPSSRSREPSTPPSSRSSPVWPNSRSGPPRPRDHVVALVAADGVADGRCPAGGRPRWCRSMCWASAGPATSTTEAAAAALVVRMEVSRMSDQESRLAGADTCGDRALSLPPAAGYPEPDRPAQPPWSVSARQQRRRLQRFRPSISGQGHLRRPRRPAVPGGDDPLQQRLSPGPAPGQLPPARRLHRAAARAADAGAPDGAPADDRRGPRCQRGVHHRGDPLLLLRPVGQEGRVPHLHRRPPGRRPARDRRRAPGDDDDAARAAGARLLLGAGRPAHRARHPGRPLPGAGPLRRDRGLARLRQRQDGHPVLPAARPQRGRRQQAPPRRRPRGDRLDRR